MQITHNQFNEIRQAIKKRKDFPTNDSVRKAIYLAIKDRLKKWIMPIQNWRLAMSRFIIRCDGFLSGYIFYGVVSKNYFQRLLN